MSDITTLSSFAPAASQLPVDWYFDDRVFELEQTYPFSAGPGYVVHRLMVPEQGDWRSLDWKDHGRMILNAGESGPDAGNWQMSNVCRHPQAIMLQGSGKLQGNLVCPIHRWTYDTFGQLIGAPHFPQNPCLNLDRVKLENWNSLLFAGPRSANADLAGMKVADEFDFTVYKLDRVEMHKCDYHWKTFIEVYLEDYHVAPSHPGLGNFVTCDDLTWQFGDWFRGRRSASPCCRKRAPAPMSAGSGRSAASAVMKAGHQRRVRSGSRTTRTSWSSGIRTCWSCRR